MVYYMNGSVSPVLKRIRFNRVCDSRTKRKRKFVKSKKQEARGKKQYVLRFILFVLILQKLIEKAAGKEIIESNCFPF